ncbi:MAG: hypothetical protein GXZ05_04240 [Gammaproteobacteria bacterium]|nr:hypothetical protein [Gammaproteobacteria bacterium]
MTSPFLTFLLPVLLLVASLSGCSKKDPGSALEEAASALEQGISQRQPKAVMKLLHQDFSGNQGLDRHTAQQQMLALFLRYKNIGVMVVNRQCQLDKGFYDRGHCSARVGISGAQGLIPERAELYRVKTTWQLQGKDWQLLKLKWE